MAASPATSLTSVARSSVSEPKQEPSRGGQDYTASLASTMPYVRLKRMAETKKGAPQKRQKTDQEEDDTVGRAVMTLLEQRQEHQQEWQAEWEAAAQPPPPPVLDDSEELFLRSCLKQMRELPQRKQSEARIEILQLLHRKRYEEPHRLPVQPPQQQHMGYQQQQHSNSTAAGIPVHDWVIFQGHDVDKDIDISKHDEGRV